MKKYTTKPFTIEAAQWNGSTLGDVITFCKENGIKPCLSLGHRDLLTGMIIPTLEGDHIAQKGDYIIKGMLGEYYPCKPEVFNAKYELIGE